MKKDASYPKHSIGEHIVPFLLVFPKDEIVSKVVSFIREKIGSWPNSESVFVVDKQNKLIGAVEFKIILSANQNQKLETIMNKDLVFLTDHSHQASAVKLAVKEGIESIPIIDQGGHFLGIIDSGQILKIMNEEHIDKLMHFSGILDNESMVHAYKSKIFNVVFARLPWLILGLIGGIFSTIIIKSYAGTLEQELSLAFFIPVIVYMNAAVGYQSQTIFIRYSAFEKQNLKRALLYELRVALIVGVVLALGIFLFTYFWIGLMVSKIVALSMFFGIIASVLLGTFIPWLLQKLGKDPAIGSGPFTTIVQDLMSVLIYFSIATILL